MGRIRKLKFGKVLDGLCFSSGSRSCFCINGFGGDEDKELEKRALIVSEGVRIGDIIGEESTQTMALQLKPKMVVLRVSMHCNGCARRVEKHISKMEGVTSYEVDLESKMVVVIGDIVPFRVLESVSKVKNAELWAITPNSI